MLQIILDALAAAGERGLTATEVVALRPDITTSDAGYHLRSAWRLGYARIIPSLPGDGILIRVQAVTPSSPPSSLVDVTDEGELAAHLADD